MPPPPEIDDDLALQNTPGLPRNIRSSSPMYLPSGSGGPIAHGTSVIQSSSALAATRTSSFAAALRKLAKQAYDSVLDDKGQHYYGSVVNLSSNANKHSSITSIHNPYQSAIVTTSMSMHSSAHRPSMDRNSEGARNPENYSAFDHRLASQSNDSSKEIIHTPSTTSPITPLR